MWSRQGCEDSGVGVDVGCDEDPDVHSLLVVSTLGLDKTEEPGGHSLEMTCSRGPRGVISAFQCLKSSDLEESTGSLSRMLSGVGWRQGQGWETSGHRKAAVSLL